MKRIQTLWTLLLTTLIGWLLPSCETCHTVLYGPLVETDTVGHMICLYGMPPGTWEKPQRVETPDEATEEEDSTHTEAK